jgi:uncharacterized repeat protein (TIGR01451 family)
MKNRILFFLYIFFISSRLLAQSGFWQEFTGPSGGFVDVVPTNNAALYALPYHINGDGTNKQTLVVYRSTDEAHTWQPLPVITPPISFITSFRVGHAGSFLISHSTIDQFWRSTDEGQTWQMLTPVTNSSKQIFETPAGTLITWDNDRFHRSSDGGQTWVAVAGPGWNAFSSAPPKRIAITQQGNILAIGKHSVTSKLVLYRSTDDGLTWQKSQGNEQVFSHYSVFETLAGSLLLFDGAWVFRSTNGGSTFVDTDLDLLVGPAQNNSYYDRLVQLSSGRILFFAYRGVYYSDDDGATWLEHNTPHRLFDAAPPVAPFSDGTILAVRAGALYRTPDGITWSLSSQGMRHAQARLEFVTSSLIYANTGNGLWKTTDGGQSWVNSVESAGLSYNMFGSDFIFKYFSRLRRFSVAGADTVVLTDGRLVWRSLDGGSSYVECTPEPPDSWYDHKYLEPYVDRGTGVFYLAYHTDSINRLYRSADVGASWEVVVEAEEPYYDSYIYASTIRRHPSGVLLCFQAGGSLLRSTDNGQTWQATDLPFPGMTTSGLWVDLEVAPDSTIFLLSGPKLAEDSTANVLLKSSNGGNSWTVLPLQGLNNLNSQWLSLEISENGHLFMATEYAAFRSVNGGETWQQLPFFAGQSYSIVDIALSPDQHLYATTDRPQNSLLRSSRPVSAGAYIRGTVSLDADADCSTPDNQLGLPGRAISATGPTYTYFTTTNNDGRYDLFVDTGAYGVKVHLPQPLWWSACDTLLPVVVDSLFTSDTVDFQVLALADCPLMTVNVGAPRLRRCSNNRVYVQYFNQGTEPADNAYVDLKLDLYLSIVHAPLPYESLGNNTYRFPVGTVPPGHFGQFSLTVYVNCDSTVIGQTHCITAHGFPDTLCMPVPAWSGANLVASATCQDSIVQLKLKNTGTVPSQLLDYIIIEDDVVLFDGQKSYLPGEELIMPQPANGRTWRVESEQEPGHPFSTLALAFAEGCGGYESLGFINQFTVNGITPSWHTFCLENTGSYDPNDKQGFPLGFGAENRIRPGQELEYRIRFQNTGTDTAFTVVIRDTLAAWLDPATLRVGASSHTCTWTLEGTGVAVFTFNNIALPDSNVNEPASHGFVSFRIGQQPGVPIGTEILNTAAIYFDFNAPVITNQTRHTVGVDYLSATTVPFRPEDPASVLISPNPVADAAVVRLRDGAFAGHHLTLHDALGQVVHQATLYGREYRLPRGNAPSGIYWYSVATGDGRRVGTGTVVFSD